MNRTSSSFSIRKPNWRNSDTFPDFLYIDTNVVLDIMEQRSHGQLSEDYLKELVKRGGMITWSNHLMEELTDYFHYQIYTQESLKLGTARSGNTHPRKVLENSATDQDSANYAKQVLQKVTGAKNYLRQLGVQSDPDVEEVNELATHLYSNYGSNLKDSKHVAIANLSGTNNILTQDSGFLRYPEVNIFGSSNGINTNVNSAVKDVNGFLDLRTLFKNNDNEEK